MDGERSNLVDASRIMLGFAERTGIFPEGVPRRYLWTDAFAVSNFLGLVRATREDRFMKVALRLITQVHHVLGRFSADDSRKGWISGIAEEGGEAHPTKGGLRIGKRLPERGVGEPFDEGLEWDRDGQYFHYLTRWMLALDLVARATGNPTFNLWARELAERAHQAFVHGSADRGERRMFWKMSVDLSRPLVPSMGHHDPLDGLVTYAGLEQTAASLDSVEDGPSLKRAIEDFRGMVHARELATADPLGIGGLLVDACRVARLTALGAMRDGSLLDSLLASALEGLYSFTLRRGVEAEAPASERLAFRELGLAIGLSAGELIEAEVDSAPARFARCREMRSRFDGLARYRPVGDAIISFWLRPESQRNPAWLEHLDINEVMLATCLVPEGYLMDGRDEARLKARATPSS